MKTEFAGNQTDIVSNAQLFVSWKGSPGRTVAQSSVVGPGAVYIQVVEIKELRRSSGPVRFPAQIEP